VAEVKMGDRTYTVEIRGDVVVVDDHEFPVSVKDDGPHLTVTAGGVPYRVQLPAEEERESGMTVQVDYRPLTYEYSGPLGAALPAARKPASRSGGGQARAAVKGAVTAQIAGRVIKVLVKPGDKVSAGDILLLLEAMKMENEIKAATDGTVSEVAVTDGQAVQEGETLVVID